MLVLVALAAVVAYLWFTRWNGHMTATRRRPAATEPYTQIVGVPRTYAQDPLPLPNDASPLTPLLRKVVDAAVPMAAPTATALPHDQTEVKSVLERVVQRVNAATPGLDLALVSFDNVRKAIDTYKNLKYEADMDVFSKRRGFGSKVAAAVDITADGKQYVRTLKVHGAQRDDGTGAMPFDDNLARQEYAAFEPAVRY